MKLTLKRALAAVLLVLSFAAPVAAGPIENATAAYDRGDYATALRLLRPLADQGNAIAQSNLGRMYDKGQGVPQDFAEAVKWYRKAADQGLAIAQNVLGFMYDKGQGVPQDYAEAIKWFRKAADQGNAIAQTNLGVMYHEGQGVPQDYAEAIKWFRKAADQDRPDAQYNLGVMYQNSQGVPRDYAEAMKWFRKAADQGHPRAQLNLGFIYANGQGVPQDYAEAMKWYRLAADQGNAIAQYNLGLMYEKGEGVPQDFVRALMWFNLSAAQGDQDAAKSQNIVAPRMTPAQIAEAQKLARQWRPAQTPSIARREQPTVEFGGERFVKKFEDAKNPADRFAEFGLESEGLDHWTKLFVFHSHPQSGNDPKRGTGNLAKVVMQRYKDANIKFLFSDTTSEAIIHFLVRPPKSDLVEVNVFKYARAANGKGLVSAQYAFRFALGEMDAEDVNNMRYRAVDEMAKFDMTAVNGYFGTTR
jgi:uncharacterized protein